MTFVQRWRIIFIPLQGLEGGWRKHYNFRCQPVDYSTNPTAMRVICLQMRLSSPYSTDVFISDGTRRLALLHGENRRAARHGVLCAAQEELAGHLLALVAPHAHAGLLVHRRQVLCW